MAESPADRIENGDTPLVACQFSVYPWFTGQQLVYDAEQDLMVASQLPKIPELYYPQGGKMVRLKMRFKVPSVYCDYSGPEALTFYLKLPPKEPGGPNVWKPRVVTRLDPKATQNVILLDFNNNKKGVARGVPLRSDLKAAPPGTVSFVNVSQIPVIVMAGESKHKVRPYGQFIHHYGDSGRGKLSVKAATIVNEKPRMILDRNFVMSDTKRIAYFAFPTNESLSRWTTKQLHLDNIPQPLKTGKGV